MAEEGAVATATSPVLPDHKRKLEHFEPEESVRADSNPSPHADSDAEKKDDEVVDGDFLEAKRSRHDEGKPDGLANENGFEGHKSNEHVENDAEELSEENQQAVDLSEPPPEEAPETKNKEEEMPVDIHETSNAEQASVEESKNENAERPSEEETGKPILDSEEPVSETETTSRKMEVPNDKVGVLIGKGGETIRYLQFNSGAKIQITRDADADPRSTTRPVELIGTINGINKAEKLINAVIAEADAGGSPSLIARGHPSSQTIGVGEQIEIQVPNEKVGLIIGRGGDTIKGVQTKSGARIQLIPQHLPEGDESKERTIRVTGDKMQIEMAREMIRDVMNQTVRPSLSSSFNQQQTYRPRGSTGPSHWGPRGPHSSQPMPYDYHQRGPYPSQNSQYPPTSYSGYPPQQMGPRSNFGSGWEQRPPPNMQGQLPHGGYDFYTGHGGRGPDHPVSAPISTPISGHASAPAPAMGPPLSQANYNYGFPHGYSQAGHPQQSYGHGYDETKYENHGSTHMVHNNQPVYSQTSNQPGYGAQQQYGKQPSYGMPSQGPPPQSYGLPRSSQAGDMPYHGPIPSHQSYSMNAQQQQQYAYASTGPVQQTYPPYGSASAADGYNQAMTVTGPGYTQQGGQPVPAYGQPGGQQTAGYVQAPGYGSYPTSQQGYQEQTAPNSAGYAYQGSQDPTYASGAQAAQPSSQQAYAQPTPTQPGYDQSVSQAGGYGAAPGNTAVGYAKTLSPQAAYPQYDPNQMYAAPH